MSNKEHLDMLHKGVGVWNSWRLEHPFIRPDLSRANLDQVSLGGVDLHNADLTKAHFQSAFLGGANLDSVDAKQAIFFEAILSHAKLRNADLTETMFQAGDYFDADFSYSNLTKADLSFGDFRRAKLTDARLFKANLFQANLTEVDFYRSDLRGAYLQNATLVSTNLERTDLTGASVYGISIWDIKIDRAVQKNLIITQHHPVITVDDLEVAQFIYLLLNNDRVRNVVDTITSKAVLILGRFTTERKKVLDAIRRELRKYNFVPIIFDFQRPLAKDFTETIMTLAGMSRFVIVDITDPMSSPLELQAVVPNFMVPVVPLIQAGQEPFSMLSDLQLKYDWVLHALVYDSLESLMHNLEASVIIPALQKYEEILLRKAQKLKVRHIHSSDKKIPRSSS
jgi:uncharacterized protein YjbI with pentapeptide repeats